MLLGFTVGGSLVGLLLTMSVFRDIIESIFIDGLTEKEYLDYLRRESGVAGGGGVGTLGRGAASPAYSLI